MNAIETRDLTRLYASGRGIRDVTLTVPQGEIFGFLGPNGAGKTTLIRTLLGFLRPQRGTIAVLGLDAVRENRAVRGRVGYLPSDPALYDFLTGAQNIEFALQLRGVRDRTRMQALADQLDIDLTRRLRSLSRGNRQKVAIVAALAHDPELIIMDEPTTGLDPLIQDAFAALIRVERARGRTVFMSSHVMSEVQSLCDRVGIIRDGELVRVAGVEELRRQRVKHGTCEFPGPAPDLSGLPGLSDWQAAGTGARFAWTGSVAPLLAALGQHAATDLTLSDPPLEEVFRTYYVGGAAR